MRIQSERTEGLAQTGLALFLLTLVATEGEARKLWLGRREKRRADRVRTTDGYGLAQVSGSGQQGFNHSSQR